ncbi:hypothetical protein [Corallococcus llansteffanensis]|uniref:Uncharacterized protein n=1 Tax=Corallococcus llansteffanensis TaxID=2316731 RepID=A0A3A8QKS1_9BACT|nr:hypothetical protein [Corallococcus llansteffanensis]RKH68418.1 hypothetical protein D7V93_01395 [Corallococcus llansteffanensis]
MLSLVAAVLLASLPTASSLSLVSPAPSFNGRPLSARLLVAQAPTGSEPELFPTAPFPDREAQDTQQLGTDEGLDARIEELAQQVSLLDGQIRSIRLGRPAGYKVMTIIGFILAPLLLIGIPVFAAGLDTAGNTGDALVTVGLVFALPGAAGVGLIIGGFTGGSRAAHARKDQRDALIQERTLREEELRELQARRDGLRTRRWQTHPSIPLFAVRF